MGVGCSRVLRCLAKSPAEAGSDPPKNTRVTFPNLLPCNKGVENSFFSSQNEANGELLSACLWPPAPGEFSTCWPASCKSGGGLADH